MPDKLPPHIRAQIEDFKRKATHNEALSNEYKGKYDKVHTPNQPTYEQWLKENGKQRMAKGGKAAYLKDSKVKNRVYHGTYDDFSTPKTSHGEDEYHKFGIHVGNAHQANKRIEDLNNPGNFSRVRDKAPSVMPLHIQAKNPLRLDENRHGRWGVDDIMHMMMNKADKGEVKSIPQEHIDDYFNDEFNMDKALGKKNDRLWSDNFAWRDNERTNALKKYLKKIGFDSIVYKNEHEGEGDSHILLDPHQIKSAIGNRGTYDPNEHDITKADGGTASLRKHVLNSEGTYGLQRMERAFDEVPNLENMYDEHALRRAFTGDGNNTNLLATIDPADFEKYAAILNDRKHREPTPSLEDKVKRHEVRKTDMSTDDYLRYLASIGKLSDVPYLHLHSDETGIPLTPMITGHEGRHRNRALAKQGVKKNLIQVFNKGALREELPRRDRQEYVDALHNQLASSHNLVYPEHRDDDERRPKIQLPDIYAKGGDVQGKPMNTPTLAQMRHSINNHGNPEIMDNIGINEAMDMDPKIFVSPNPHDRGIPATGGVADSRGLPIGGVDTNSQQPGQQLNPQAPAQPGQVPGQQPGQPPEGMGSAPPPSGPTPPEGNMLSMTPQGQTMQAMQPQGQPPQGLAEGGQPKRMFKIQSAGHQEKRKEPEFTPYEPRDISIKKLARAFDEAIAHHRSLPNEERIMNSYNAAQKLGKLIGVNPNGMTKDLLGKNAKLLKTEQGKVEELKLPDGRGVETTGLALAPAYEEEGFTTCPNSASCKKECLGKTSGNYHKLGGGADLSEFKGPRLNSLKKTQAFLHDPHSFAVKLHDEIQAAKEMAGANNNHLGVRLNVLSDVNPRVHKSIIEAHPDVTFYDYTKNNTNPIAPNHHYTYSSTGVSQEGVDNPNTNWKQMRKRLQGGDNVAMAFSHKGHIPETVHDEETGHKFKVINGDTHDFRPMDMQPEGQHGVIVGLKNKKATGRMNEAHIDSHGFFVHHDPKEKIVPNKNGKPIFARDAKGNTIAQNKEVRIKPQYEELKLATNDDGDKV